MSWFVLRKCWPWILGGLCVLGTILVAGVGYFIWAQENKWVVPPAETPEEAFAEGSIGTEWIPLSVLEALPKVFPERFAVVGRAELDEEAGDWVDRFGFLREEGESLPVGFVTNQFRPRTAVSSPIPFVGLSCATCHRGELLAPDGRTIVVEGMGNSRLDLAGFLEATRGALMSPEEELNTDRIAEEVEMSVTERVLVGRWLSQMREELQAEIGLRGEPLGPLEVEDPLWVGDGPGRLHSLSELMMAHKGRRARSTATGGDFAGYTKIPAVFRQGLREWQQVDGSIGDEEARTTVDVLSAGATAESLARPAVQTNLSMSTAYTRDLEGPSYEVLFPDEIRTDFLAKGKEVYELHCARCHGDREKDGTYRVSGPLYELVGQITPAVEIGTDGERVELRGGKGLPGLFSSLLMEDHPRSISPHVVRASDGYVNAPLDSVFARAPYLHNGSVPTLAALLHLEERPAVFYRGRNFYDPYRVGLNVPLEPEPGQRFRFDTSKVGNSNRGHDIPWTREEVLADPEREADLEALLEYLKTL